MKEILLIEKRDGIPCVIIFPWLYGISIGHEMSRMWPCNFPDPIVFTRAYKYTNQITFLQFSFMT